jgi:hypothetical protein
MTERLSCLVAHGPGYEEEAPVDEEKVIRKSDQREPSGVAHS